MSEKSSIAQQSVWAVSAQVALTLGAIASSVLLNRVLKPEGRGQVALIVLWPTVAAGVVGAGWTPALSYFVSRRPDEGLRRWMAASGVCLALALPVLVGSWWLAPRIVPEAPWLRSAAHAFWLFLPLSLLAGYAVAVLEAWGQFNVTAYLRLGNTGFMLLAMLGLFACHHLLPTTYVWLLLAAAAAMTICGLWLLLRRSGFRLGRPILRGLPGYVVRAAPLAWALVLQQRVDQMLITTLAPRDDAAFGVYVASAAAGGLLAPIATGLALVLVPAGATRTPDEAVALFARMGRIFVLAVALCALPLALTATWLLSFAFGSGFAAGAPAFRAALLTTLVGGTLSMAISTLQGMNKPGTATVVGISTLALSSAAGALLLPGAGYVGAAYGLVLGQACGLALLIWWGLRGQGFSVLSLAPRWEDVRYLRSRGMGLLARR